MKGNYGFDDRHLLEQTSVAGLCDESDGKVGPVKLLSSFILVLFSLGFLNVTFERTNSCILVSFTPRPEPSRREPFVAADDVLASS